MAGYISDPAPDIGQFAYADKFAEATALQLRDTAFENLPFIGTLSQIGGVSYIVDEKKYLRQIMEL